jgi:gamma-tubulin complex component 3
MRVQSYIKDCGSRLGVGMIEQSLCHHLHAQLTEYYKLVAILESQMSTGSRLDSEHGRSTPGENQDEAGLTLRRLDDCMNDWRLRMRMMSVCVEGARGKHVPVSPVSRLPTVPLI